jgi:hypothetical protein
MHWLANFLHGKNGPLLASARSLDTTSIWRKTNLFAPLLLATRLTPRRVHAKRAKNDDARANSSRARTTAAVGNRRNFSQLNQLKSVVGVFANDEGRENRNVIAFA